MDNPLTHTSKSHNLQNPFPCWHYTVTKCLHVKLVSFLNFKNNYDYIIKKYRIGDCLDSCASGRKPVAVSREQRK
jgi:hypothetical protein